jgi:YgiT-type zinc finger domain-containing protein
LGGGGITMICEKCKVEMIQKKADVQLDLGDRYAVFKDLNAYECPGCGAQELVNRNVRLEDAEIVSKEGNI